MVSEIVNNILSVFLIGSLALLGFIHIANPWKINKKGNTFFGICFIIWSSFWLEEFIDLVGLRAMPEEWMVPLRSLQIFIAPTLFFSAVFYSNPFYHFTVKDLIHLILPSVYILTLVAKFTFHIQAGLLLYIMIGITSFQILFYTILSWLKIRRHRKRLLRFASSNQGVDLDWLEYIILQIFIISLIVVIYNLVFDEEKAGLVINGVNVIASYVIAYFSLRQKEIYPIKKGREKELEYLNKDEEEEPTKRKLLSDQELKSTKNQLELIMQKEKPYLDSDLNLVKLADMLEITPHHLSFTINNGFDQNFFQFVNQHRVEKAKELLIDQSHNYTILAIAFESGFNSKTSFNTTFKKLTGQTPTEFKKTAI